MPPDLTSYDSVLYKSHPQPQTHPDRLAVIGSLFGLEPAPPEHCRVLELGCGTGGNLVPMAFSLPASEFVGIDLAATSIARGQEMVAALGLTNVRLVHGSVTGIDSGWGRFDYIVAHGLYSWVPPDVRESTLAICRLCLAPQGIAYISYNALPGCRMRHMLREMMLFHVRDIEDASERIRQARALMQFLAEAQDKEDAYHLWLKAEAKRVLEQDEGLLFHDDLAAVNEPLYFFQFMRQAAAHELQYAGEADFFEMADHYFKEPARKILSELAPNRLLREQYLDFLKCRRFRQTLLCHREVSLQLQPLVEKVPAFFVSSLVKCTQAEPDLRAGMTLTFGNSKGAKVETDFLLGNAALLTLEAASPVPLPFDELLRQALARLAQAGVPDEDLASAASRLSDFLLRIFGGGVLDLRLNHPTITGSVSERPVASALARRQARDGENLTSLLHLPVRLEDEISRQLLTWLDGTQDISALAVRVCDLLKSSARGDVELQLHKNLARLARLGLLTG